MACGTITGETKLKLTKTLSSVGIFLFSKKICFFLFLNGCKTWAIVHSTISYRVAFIIEGRGFLSPSVRQVPPGSTKQSVSLEKLCHQNASHTPGPWQIGWSCSEAQTLSTGRLGCPRCFTSAMISAEFKPKKKKKKLGHCLEQTRWSSCAWWVPGTSFHLLACNHAASSLGYATANTSAGNVTLISNLDWKQQVHTQSLKRHVCVYLDYSEKWLTSKESLYTRSHGYHRKKNATTRWVWYWLSACISLRLCPELE